MSKVAKRPVIVSVRLSREELKRLQELSQETDLPLSITIRTAIKDLIERSEQEGNVLSTPSVEYLVFKLADVTDQLRKVVSQEYSLSEYSLRPMDPWAHPMDIYPDPEGPDYLDLEHDINSPN